MYYCNSLIVICIISVSQCSLLSRNSIRQFPDGFLFGTATASYQVEGAWNASDKSENIWDHLVHSQPWMVKDFSNGDIAASSYYLYKRDVEMMRELGLDFYRFSLSWTRLFPTGFPNKISAAGVTYYNNLINEMLKHNIQPMITIFHWDLPQNLQELGGWTNAEIIKWYSDYARTVFQLFGDRVHYWITINEPHIVCYGGYGSKLFAPALDIKGVADYMCAKNLLLAHAKAYHIYNKEFRPTQNGFIFISFSSQWYEPLTEDEADIEGAYDANQFHLAQYAHPIFSRTGGFPPRMVERIASKSAAQGFPKSRLPEFTAAEIELVRGSSDFFGLNHYMTSYVYRNESTSNYHEAPSYLDDLEILEYHLPEWTIGESNYIKFVPWGFYKILKQIMEDYDNPPVFITENGLATYGGLKDDDRVSYYRGYLSALLDAIDEGCDIRAYTAWSLLDNFEWFEGYTQCFGLYEVDFKNPNRTRTARKSAYVYKEIINTRALDHGYEPDMSKAITIDEGH